MELAFIFYLFAAFIITPATFFILTSFKMYIAAVIVSVALLIYFILFGLQIFTPEGKFNQPDDSSTMKFPPKISICPDMFTLYQEDGSGTNVRYFCVEMVGLGGSSTSGIQTYYPTNEANIQTTPTERMKFDLKVEIESDAERKKQLVNVCRDKGITWEGIFDGTQEYDNVIPRPNRTN